MRWEDERYVRIYTRDTPGLKVLEWESRALLWELLRKCDRAGIIDLGKTGVKGLAKTVDMPVEVVETALKELVTAETVTLRDNILLVPKFIEAQEASSSDKERQRKCRETARAKARAVTICDEMSQPVTACHSVSQAVTPSLAVPSRAEPSQKEVSPPNGVGEVFRYWQSKGHRMPRAQDLIKLTRDRLKTYTPQDICVAIDGLHASPWHNGSDPKTNGKSYLELKQVVRADERVEKFMGMAEEPKPKTATERAMERRQPSLLLESGNG